MVFTKEHLRRRRARERRDPTTRMSRTLAFEQGTIPTSTVLPDPTRDSVCSFVLTATRDAAASNGLLFEIGGGPRGVAAYIDDTGLVGFVAGEGSGDEGVLVSTPTGLSVGETAKFIFACSAGDGWAWMFKNGVQVAKGQSEAGDFGGAWSATGNGSIPGAPPASSRVPANQKVALADATIIGGLDVYLYQLPRGAYRG